MAKNILVFGASETYGFWDPEGGWVTRLRKFIDAENIQKHLTDSNFNLIYNLGISDETSGDVLERFEAETKARFWGEAENIVIFAIGDNDALFNNKTRTNETPLDKFENNLKKLIEIAKNYYQKIIFIGSFPTDGRVDPMPWLPDCSYKTEDIKKYNEMVRLVCEVNKVEFIEIYQKYINQDHSRFLADGIHPNSEGHEIIFEAVKDCLR